MSEQDAKPNGEESNDQNDANKPGGEQGGSNDDSKGGFKAITSQADLDRIITNRLNRDRDALRKTLKDEIDADVRAEEAKKQGNFQKLYEDLEGKYKALESSIAERDLKDRRIAAAKAARLPDDMADRLRGDTDEELEADAKELAKHLRTQDALDTDAGERTAKGTRKPDKGQWSDPTKWGLRTG